MQTQMTLDGKSMFSSITNENFVKIVDRFARKQPQRFVEYCANEGIVYHGKPSMLKTIRCIGKLEEHFGIASEGMINALMTYPIED
jgi:hypothetical protein